MSDDYIYQAMPGTNFPQSSQFARGYQSAGPGFSEWSLDPKDVLELIEHSLRGEFWDSNEKMWITRNHQETEIKEQVRFDAILNKNITELVKVPTGRPSAKSFTVRPLLSDDGIADLLRDITSRVHRVVLMSNWTEKQLNDWLWDLSDDLDCKLFLNFVKWDIKFEDLDSISNIVMVNTDATMRRALLEGERRRIYEATKTTEQIIQERDKQKQGILASIPLIGGLAR